jgi:hypothetical protein
VRVIARAFGTTVALAFLLAGATAGPDSREDQAVSAQTAGKVEDPRALAGTIAAPWLARQHANGSFPDYMAARRSPARDLYGEAMLGYGLLKSGLQRRDARAVDAGLRALAHAVATPRPFHSIVFENLALAAAYNLAREALPRHPLFSANRLRWESRLRRVRPTWLGRGRGRYFNQHLVDAVAVIELARSGLRSRLAGTVSSDPGRARRLAERLVNRGLPAGLSSRTARSARVGATTLASDGALAYHALTLGFYARAVGLLGNRASAKARALVGRLGRASWALAAPDGDIAYFGRSQEQAWTLALTAYGAEVVANGAAPAWAARHRASSDRALRRLRAVHLGGPDGLYLTPAFRTDPRAAIAAQEDYVSGSAYSGLTLVALGWAGDRLGARRSRPGRLAAEGRGGMLLDRGRRRFAAVSTGRVWFAVRKLPAGPGELVSGAGLVALKVKDHRGRWQDALAHGIRGRPTDSAGPLLRVPGGRAGIPVGRALVLQRGPSVRLAADLVTSTGRVVRRGAIIVAPARCGVRMTPGARAGERWEYSAFLPASPRPRRLSKRTIASGGLRTGYRGAGHVVTGGRYTSPSYGRLVRSRLLVTGRSIFSVGIGRCLGQPETIP